MRFREEETDTVVCPATCASSGGTKMPDATLPSTQADAAEAPPVVEQRSRTGHHDDTVGEPVEPPAAEAPPEAEAEAEAQPADERRGPRPGGRARCRPTVRVPRSSSS